MITDKELIEKAESGDVNSQRALALLYEIGLEFEMDIEKSLQWWIRVAETGDKLALLSVAEIMRQEEFKNDPDKLKKWTNRCQNLNLEKVSKRSLSAVRSRVLIVDDAKFQCDFIAKVCEMKGLETILASSGEEALKFAIEYPDIKLVFLDLAMPKMNGVQFLKTIRKMNVLDGVPVIIVSQNVSKQIILELKKLKINSFIAKPASPGQIEKYLTNYNISER